MIRLSTALLLLALARPLHAEQGREIATLAEAARRRHVARLVELGPGGWVHLQVLAAHPDPRVRSTVARGLSRVERETGGPLLEKLVGDADPLVRSAAVSSLFLGYRTHGIQQLKSILSRDRRRWPELESSVRYWSGVYTVQELNAQIGPDGTGWYPGMFDKLKPLGSWSTEPLLRIFSRATTPGRMTQMQRMAGNALGDLGDAGAIPGLEQVLSQARRSGAEAQKRNAAISLHKLGKRGPALEIIRLLRQLGRLAPGQRAKDLFDLGYMLHQIREFEEAITQYRKIVVELGSNKIHVPTAHYNMACAYAMLKKPEHALFNLHQALKKGYAQKSKWIARDRELDPIRKDPRFAKMLANPRASVRFDLAREKRR